MNSISYHSAVQLRAVICTLSLIFGYGVQHGSAQSYPISNGSVNDCSGTFYDSGGSSGNYGNNESFVFTLCPDGGAGSGANTTIEFTQWAVQAGVADNLKIYNGTTTAAPLLTTGSGSNSLLNQVYTASGATGCLTFDWTSDGSGTGSGWAASILTGPNAGSNASTTVCSNDATFDMFTLLGGTPDAGGTWEDPLSNPHSNFFDPSLDPDGIYSYTVSGGGACTDVTATVNITVVSAPDAGGNSSLGVCDDDPTVNLLGVLSGTPDGGGTWNGPSGPHSGTLDPASDSPGTYTYTVLGTAPCSDASSAVTVVISNAPDAGTNGTIAVCSDEPPFNLFDELVGTPDAGGTSTRSQRFGTSS